MLMIMAMLVLTFTVMEHIGFQSSMQAFCKDKEKMEVKISDMLIANLQHKEIMSKCGFLWGGGPLF